MELGKLRAAVLVIITLGIIKKLKGCSEHTQRKQTYLFSDPKTLVTFC